MEMTQFSFPEMFSIGRILVWDEHYEGWFNLGPAQGLFSYEPDRRYRLEIDADRMEELSADVSAHQGTTSSRQGERQVHPLSFTINAS